MKFISVRSMFKLREGQIILQKYSFLNYDLVSNLLEILPLLYYKLLFLSIFLVLRLHPRYIFFFVLSFATR